MVIYNNNDNECIYGYLTTPQHEYSISCWVSDNGIW